MEYNENVSGRLMRLNGGLVDRQGASLNCAWPSLVCEIAQG